MPMSTKELKLAYKYAELPDEPAKYRKKKKKKSRKKSDHKHQYEPCLFDYHTSLLQNGIEKPCMYGGTYCVICGRIGDITIGCKRITNDNLPIFEIDSWFDKFVNLNGD